jgi:hypothetical protein
VTDAQNSVNDDAPEPAAPGWRDDPISKPSEDELGRTKFAEHTAALINNTHSADSSVVYGLEGPWGSGKSSAISLTTHYLAKVSDGRWKVVYFTPWATSGPETLLQEFFNALSTALPEGGDRAAKRRRRRFLKSVSKYADIARPLMAAIPFVGAGLVEVSRTAEGRLQKPWNEAFKDISDELKSLGLPILVIVDDIDRLQPGELLDLLKVVRLLGRFPGVDFLLSYDERTIVDTLQDPQRGTVTKARARAFMEKIVQYPLSMPPLLTGKISKMLGEGLTGIVAVERAEASPDTRRLTDLLLGPIARQLNTPRAIQRFLAQSRQQFDIHDVDEMNETDLILITFIRVQFPDLFNQLQDWRPELTGTHRSWPFPGQDKEPPWDDLFKVIDDEKDRMDARETLQTLFPAIGSKNPVLAPAKRMAHPDYFNRYLAQTIPDGDIPDAVITAALAAGAAGDAARLRRLLLGGDYERAMLALSKIRIRYPDPSVQYFEHGASPGPVTSDLIRVGMAIINDLPERMAAWTEELSTTTYWIANLSRIAVSKTPELDLVDLYAACDSIERRAYVVHIALGELERLPEPAQAALRRLHNEVAALVMHELLTDLRGRDNSTSQTTGPFLYRFVLTSDIGPDLQTAAQNAIANGDFTEEDVAARFVGFAYVVGGTGTPSSASFSGDLFTTLTGIPANSTDSNERDDWTDANWARKREFAMRYVRPETGEAAPGDPAAESPDV